MFKAYMLRSKAWLSIVSCLVIMLTVLSACAQDQNGGTAPTFTNSTPITIGISLSLSKDFSSDGVLMQQGYETWANLVNSSGGLLGRQVVLKDVPLAGVRSGVDHKQRVGVSGRAEQHERGQRYRTGC